MKKKLVLFLLVLSVTGTAGCATLSTWWQNFQSDPVAQEQAFAQSVQTALNIAEVTWSGVAAFLPTNVLVKAQPVYNAAVLTANNTLVALNDLVAADVAAQAASPNFATVVQQVSDAVTAIMGIIQTYQNMVNTGDAGAAPTVDLTPLQNAVASMKRVGHTR